VRYDIYIYVIRQLRVKGQSPDRRSCDSDLIPRLKQTLHGKQFGNRDYILTAVHREVAQISASSDADGVCHLPRHRQLTTGKLGDYYKGC
jgi:hypothetical protein